MSCSKIQSGFIQARLRKIQGLFKDKFIFFKALFNNVTQGFSWTEIHFGQNVRAAPILFGHLEIF